VVNVDKQLAIRHTMCLTKTGDDFLLRDVRAFVEAVEEASCYRAEIEVDVLGTLTASWVEVIR
jgi:hypothetical protein